MVPRGGGAQRRWTSGALFLRGSEGGPAGPRLPLIPDKSLTENLTCVLTRTEKCHIPISRFFANERPRENVTLEISWGTDSRPYRFE